MGLESYFYKINKKINSLQELEDIELLAINKSEQIDFDIVNVFNKEGKDGVLNTFFKDELVGDNDMQFLDFRISLALANVKDYKKAYLEELKKKNHNPIIRELLIHWNSHGDLQRYMVSLSLIKGFSYNINYTNLILTKEDLTTLIVICKLAINKEYNPSIVGFNWKDSTKEKWQSTIEIIEKILETTDFSKETIYYHGSW